MHSPNRLFKVIVLWVTLLAIFLYGFYEFRGYLYGPTLTITTPENGEKIEDGAVTVSGTARGINEITLNGRPIFIDEKGFFSETIALMEGYNKITVEVADRFENHQIEVREVMSTYEIVPEEPSTASSTPEKTGATTKKTGPEERL